MRERPYPFLDSLSAADIVLTPNLRLARHLHEAYCERQTDPAWETPRIYATQTWLHILWDQLRDKGCDFPWILSEQQADILWYNIISKHSHDKPLLNTRQTVKHAHSALQTLLLWEQDIQTVRSQTISEHLPYYHWVDQFLAFCQANDCIIEQAMPQILIKHLNQIEFDATTLYRVAFDDTPPAIARLNSALTAYLTIQEVDTRQKQSHPRLHRSLDKKNEILEMTRWAKHHFDKGVLRIGCVCVDLQSERAKLNTLFHEQFHDPSHYNISSGIQLSDVPIIHCALQLCRLNPKQLELNTVSALLLSPFIGCAEYEKTPRSLLERAIREKGYLRLTLNKLIEFAQLDEHYCPEFISILTRFADINHMTFSQSPAMWANTFSTMLIAAGWPGERLLNSEQYQATQHWHELFAHFASLEIIQPNMTLSEALSQLHHMASDRIFQVQTKNARVQVLGALEAGGIQFDALWVMGLTDETWPPSPNPNPFIPRQLQFEQNMPHASAEREFDFANKLTRRLSHSASDVIFSYAEHENDHENLPSPLISHLPRVQQLELSEYNAILSTIYQSKKTESYQLDDAPAVADSDNIHGGSFILKYQAQCPFSAFAYFRLHTEGEPTVHEGVDSLTRGIILHDTLEHIWKELHSQQALLNMQEDELHELISQNIDLAMSHLDPHRIPEHYLSIEKSRLFPIIHEWLTLEKKRKPFRIKALENTREIQLGRLSMRLRADRIDINDRGQEIIIDYKTGSVNLADCFSTRIREPQLPLYVLSDAHIRAIAYGQIRQTQISITGVGEDNAIEHDVVSIEEYRYAHSSSWTQQRETWQKQTEELADEFMQGHAAVEPQFNDSCTYCDLRSLCRIDELNRPDNQSEYPIHE